MTDTPRVLTTFTPVAALIEAARAVLRHADSNEAWASLEAAVKTIDENIDVAARPEHQAAIELARERYALGSSDDVEIDDLPLLSPTDNGCWVMGWLWVERDLYQGFAEDPAEATGP